MVSAKFSCLDNRYQPLPSIFIFQASEQRESYVGNKAKNNLQNQVINVESEPIVPCCKFGRVTLLLCMSKAPFLFLAIYSHPSTLICLLIHLTARNSISIDNHHIKGSATSFNYKHILMSMLTEAS